MICDSSFIQTKKPPIEIIGIEKCTGCFGCANACKYDAIQMKLSSEGFYFPEINKNKCINCGACNRNCPVLNYYSDNLTKENINVFAGCSTNDTVRMESSSGGIFTEIAEHFIEIGGIVFGAAWEENLNVKHVGISEKSGLFKLRSSKYIQSNLDSIYSQIANLVQNENRKVLFTGTPCQVAALKTFTESENLFLVDVLCHGIPSKLVFDEYVNYISKGHKVESFNFRDKSSGWSKYKTKIVFDNGETYECITRQDPFFHGFICDLYLNSSCYNCKFASIPRAGDLTIGDFWRISEDLMDEKGVSVILSNNAKGLALLQELEKHKKVKLYNKNIDDAIKGNPRIYDGFLNMRRKRTEILDMVKTEGFEYIMKNYIEKTDRYIPDNEE